jgi:cob(I)alamin adenosyltransferase
MNANVGSGDRGMTSLLSGERVPKTHPRVEACGELDELASVLGALAASLGPDTDGLRREIQDIQGTLLHIGATLATSSDSATAGMLRAIGAEDTRTLERAIERMEQALPPLQGFILPGGHPSAAWAHVARTVCRRAERRALAIPGNPAEDSRLAAILAWLNRLSSYLFVLARACNAMRGVPETTWKG